MQLQIEVILAPSHAAPAAAREAAVRRIIDAAALRHVDLDAALRDGVLRGVISSERVLDLAMLDAVGDFALTVG